MTRFILLVALFGAGGDNKEPAPPRFLLEWGKQGSEPGDLHFPIGIAINPRDDVFVADFYNDRVQRFSADGKFLSVFATLPHPGAIALDGDGNLVISHFGIAKQNEERKPDRITVYSPDGKLLRTWGKSGTGDGEFDMPGGIAIVKDG